MNTQQMPSAIAMMRAATMRTSEHVSQGHPDKACDQFADSILDSVLDAARAVGASNPSDPNHATHQRTAIEMLVKDHLVVVSGEVRMGPEIAPRVRIADIIRSKWADIGYPDADKITVMDHVQVQSPELQVSSDNDGAGDQGIMVGFATNETKSGLPREYEAARDLCVRIQDLGRSGIAPWVRADAKTQVTLNAVGDVERIVIAVQHAAEVEGERETRAIQSRIKAALTEHAIQPLFGALPPNNITVNGTGSFAIGGPIGDAGVVGRKIVVDAYGPHVAVGGGAYSGKDPTKVDRSAAYMARYIAKTAAHMRIRDAREVTVHIAYCIGLRQPEMVTAITDAGVDISDWVRSRFSDLAPRTIAETLGLWRVSPEVSWRYQDTAAFGHYGRDIFPWEKIAPVSD
jgi:S-adenosylmethionine synthetase